MGPRYPLACYPETRQRASELFNFCGGSPFRFHAAEFQPHPSPVPGLDPRTRNGGDCGDDGRAKRDQELAEVGIASRVSGYAGNLEPAFTKASLNRVEARTPMT